MTLYAALHLVDGQTIVAEILDEGDTICLVSYPLELRTSADRNGLAKFSFIRYMPYSEDGNVAIYSRNVISLSMLSEEFSSYYVKYVERFKQMQKDAEEEAKQAKEEEASSPSDTEVSKAMEEFLNSILKKKLH